MVRCFSAYLDFTYIVRASVFNEDTLRSLDSALQRFYQYRPIFQEAGVREPGPNGFNLPRQHSIKHYREMIPEFGAPNGLCSSITESKHVKAIKQPFRLTGRGYLALDEMLVINQRLDKLMAARVGFNHRGMLHGPVVAAGVEVILGDEDDDGGPVHGAAVLNHVVLARTPGVLYNCSKLIFF